MTNLILVIVVIACFVLGFFILVQKPKGGGLSGAFGSIGSQVMGVKQSTDAMEKGTWYTMIIIAALCVLSVFTLPKALRPANNDQQQQQEQSTKGDQPAQQQPASKPVQ